MQAGRRASIGVAAIWLGIAGAAPAQRLAPTVAAGTEIELMVLAEVSARSAVPGDIVRLRLNKPVEADGMVVLPVGTAGFGEVEAVEKSGMALKRGKLAVRVTHLLLNGRTIPLDGEIASRAKGGEGDDAAKIILAPFYVLFSPGNSAKFRAGELIRARLSTDFPALAVPSSQ